ncbi:hypothetical protein Ddc_02266 [Ditylenchus destructor]|nr:hypothetical protein Ddc_02266 [Ditylenchus destructor]
MQNFRASQGNLTDLRAMGQIKAFSKTLQATRLEIRAMPFHPMGCAWNHRERKRVTNERGSPGQPTAHYSSFGEEEASLEGMIHRFRGFVRHSFIANHTRNSESPRFTTRPRFYEAEC